MPNVKYSAVVLTNKSRDVLLKKIKPVHNDVIAHHMTIKMGELKENDREFLGREVVLEVTAHAIDDKVQAVMVAQVSPQPTSKNKIPHITISVNRANKGKPVMSNDLSNWMVIEPFEISGVISEIS